MRMRLALAFAALSLAACNGPKETCAGSFESYFSMLEDHDYEGMYEMLTPEFKKKVRSVEGFSRAMNEEWFGTHGFSKKVDNVAETAGGVCTARGVMSWTWRVRGKEAESYDDVFFAWTFRRQKDGKWYIDLPGYEKITAF